MNTRGDKRTFENEDSSSSHGSPSKQQRSSSPDRTDAATCMRNDKVIMAQVKHELSECECEEVPTKTFNQNIREIISKLDTTTRKKTTVGVFGKTGAGKSSLINAILGETDLLPSGTINACTSVIIQVEVNVTDSNYTAEIEFISKKEWEEELKTLLGVLSEDGEERNNAIFSTANQKITALYGGDGVWKGRSIEDLMKDDKFSKIPEFLRSETKNITCERASELADKIECYIRHDNSSPGGCYWPVVKSVTIKVPHCKDFLEHIVLVDLPGTGDCNKSRDQMWRSKLRECSRVWIVSEINRAGSDKDTWELVSNSVADMAHGGECRSITFICTKTDDINPQKYMRSLKLKDEDLQITPEESQRVNKIKNACILHRNVEAKESVRKDFFQQYTIKKHFDCNDEDFFSVFTVSSEEFTKGDPILEPEDTEIPKLKDFLRKYNDIQTNEKASHYISGALEILFLIQGYKKIDTPMIAERARLLNEVNGNLESAVGQLRQYCDHICSSLEELLSKGATESEEKCVETAKEVIMPENKDGRGFHRTLTALCKNDGSHRSRIGEIDLNRDLAKHMFHHINEAFSDFFPVQQKVTEKSLQANIDKFTIITEELIKNYENSIELSPKLEFLKMEEIKLKTELKQEIVEQKKKIYTSLPESIKSTMLPAYRSADEEKGTHSMRKKQALLLNHIKSSKDEMFQKAKTEMLKLIENTKDFTVQKIKSGLMEVMMQSLHTEHTLPFIDVSQEIEELIRSYPLMSLINYLQKNYKKFL